MRSAQTNHTWLHFAAQHLTENAFPRFRPKARFALVILSHPAFISGFRVSSDNFHYPLFHEGRRRPLFTPDTRRNLTPVAHYPGVVSSAGPRRECVACFFQSVRYRLAYDAAHCPSVFRPTDREGALLVRLLPICGATVRKIPRYRVFISSNPP